MRSNLLVGVLGKRDSGKSTTWYELFGRKVKTGKHKLRFDNGKYVDVFVVSGSPEERKKYVGEIVNADAPSIVLCAMQYKTEVIGTVNFFDQRDYFMFVHWLNPGYEDEPMTMFDSLGLIPVLLAKGALVGIRDGQVDPSDRVGEIRDFVYGWAKSRNLLKRRP